jgi:dTDP-4-dehydrorhamnose reductase
VNIGVSGAKGMLGSHLCKILNDSKTHNVFNLSLVYDFRKINEALLIEFVRKNAIDAIVNCAATMDPNNKNDYNVNAHLPRFLYNVLKKSNSNNQKFIHISSINVLLESRINLYSQSKRAAEESLRDTSAIILRPHLIWSKTSEGDHKKLLDYINSPFPLKLIPYPGHIFWPVDVDSLAYYICNILNKEINSSIINIQGERKYSLWDLSHALNRDKKKLIPVPTLFIEKIFPSQIKNKFPISMRSTNTLDYNYDWALKESFSVNLPGPTPEK